jgi:acid phosphatase type 7
MLGQMRSKLFLLAGVIAAGCGGGGDDDGGDDDGTTPVELNGGRVTIESCGYDLVTREGAEAPQPGWTVLGADPAPKQIHLGLGSDSPATSINVVWKTDLDTAASTVRYGVAGSVDNVVEGYTYRYASAFDGQSDLVRIHEAHLCGLTADTEYTYQVGGVDDAGNEAWSDPYMFRTAPDLTASPDAEVSIAYVGDSRGGYDVWTELAAQIATRAPDLIVYTGDVVTLGQYQEEWDAFFEGAQALLASTPMITAHGNHEVNSVHYYSQLAMPGDEENYAIDYGAVHQVILNTDPLNVGDLTTTVPEFLDADLTAADGPWTFVSMHRALWSSSTTHGTDETLKSAIGPVLDSHSVDVVIAGHDHIFERTKPLIGDAVGSFNPDGSVNGTIFLVSGGAGAGLYSIEDPLPAYSEVALSTYNATVLQVRTGMLVAETFDQAGAEVDSFMITKPPAN